jgi:hypothetical protein
VKKEEFFALADVIFDHEGTDAELTQFENAIEAEPVWMDEWVDQKTALQSALGLEPIQPTPNFTSSLTARWQAQKIKQSIQYWTPAALASVAAAIGLFAILQILGSPTQNETFGRPQAEARLEKASSVQFPSLTEPSNR